MCIKFILSIKCETFPFEIEIKKINLSLVPGKMGMRKIQY